MIGKKKVLAVVLARKGSKGIPGKNFRDLLGKPLFLWSVEAGLKSKYVDRVVISSNDKKVYDIFKEFVDPRIERWASLYHEIPNNPDIHIDPIPHFIQRPDEISGDLSKNEEALIHVIDFYKGRGTSDYDIVVNLQVTSPCRTDGFVDRCIEAYDEGGYDSLLTGTKDTPFLWRKENGKWEYIVDRNDCCERKMRQEFKDDNMDSEMVLHDNGNLYITDTKILLDKKCRIGYNPCVFETKGINGLQIDEEFDFELIETMAKVKKLKSLI